MSAWLTKTRVDTAPSLVASVAVHDARAATLNELADVFEAQYTALVGSLIDAHQRSSPDSQDAVRAPVACHWLRGFIEASSDILCDRRQESLSRHSKGPLTREDKQCLREIERQTEKAWQAMCATMHPEAVRLIQCHASMPDATRTALFGTTPHDTVTTSIEQCDDRNGGGRSHGGSDVYVTINGKTLEA